MLCTFSLNRSREHLRYCSSIQAAQSPSCRDIPCSRHSGLYLQSDQHMQRDRIHVLVRTLQNLPRQRIRILRAQELRILR
jgi:hypothetical protein